MNARNRGLGIGFVSGLAVAIACRSTSSSVVDASAADSAAMVDGTRADGAGADGPAPGTTVADRLRVRTADSDGDQLEDGSAALPGRSTMSVLVVAGPIVITDVWRTSPFIFLSVSSTDDCKTSIVRPQIGLGHLRDGTLHNIRVAVKTGEFLCASSVSDNFESFEWSGYRPYQPN